MAKFYETETPITVETLDGEVRYFKEARRFQISLPKWVDGYGETHFGKTVTLPIDKFKGNEDLKNLLNLVLADL